MGQQCAREQQRQNGNVVQAKSENSSRQMIGQISESVTHRQSIYHSDLEEISIRVPPYALLPFMAIFREKCKDERRNFLASSGEKHVSKLNKKSWKRVTLTDTSLHSMFPCIQTEHIGSLIRNTIGYNANSSVPTSFNRSQQLLYSQIDSLVLVDQMRLSAAFHIASHLCKPENLQYIGYKQELLFQDFLIALAICLRGTREEMMIFLFLLFADVSLPVVVAPPLPVPSQPEAPVPKKESTRFGLGPFTISRDEKSDSQHAATRKRSYTDPHHGTKSTGVDHTVTQTDSSSARRAGDGVSSGSKEISAGHAAGSRTRHASFDQTIGTAEAREASVGEPPAYSLKAMAASLSTVGAGNGVKYSNNNLSDSSLQGHANNDKKRKPSHSEVSSVGHNHSDSEARRFANPLLSSLGLSEGAVYRLLLFFHLARKHSPYIPLCEDGEKNSQEDVPTSASDDAAHLETILDLVGRISTAPDLVRGSVGGGVSFDSFMSLLYPMLPAGDGIGYVTSGVGSLLLARTLRGTDYTNTGLSSETLRRVLYVFANDLVQSPYQMLKHCRDFFRTNADQRILRRSLLLVEGDILVQHTLPDYHVFLLDAQWWRAWCAAMEVRAVYASSVEGNALSFLVIDILPEDVLSDETLRVFKHQRVSAFQSDPALKSLSRLRNSRLVSQNSLGVYSLRSNEAAIAAMGFVALPFDLGRVLYAHYDKHAKVIPAEVYRRRLNFGSSAVAQQDTPRGQITSSVNNFITNFYATNCTFVELQPRILPVYFCTASGLAATTFSDVLTIRDSDAAYTILNEGVCATLTVEDFLLMQLQRVLSEGQQVEVAGQCRLWALHRSDKTRQQVESSADSRYVLCHGLDTEWHLLEDRTVDLFSPACREILGLMVENLSTDKLWPSDRVASLAYCASSSTTASLLNKTKNVLLNGATHSTIVTSESPNEEDLRGQCSAPNSARGARNGSEMNGSSHARAARPDLYHIGQLVDVLTDSNCFAPGEVISIAREQQVDHSVAMLVTLRLAEPILGIGGEAMDTVILPYYSPRILPRGSMSGLFSNSAPGSTLGPSLALLHSLIDAADNFAHSQNLLAADKSLRVSRTVLHKKYKTTHRHRASDAVVNPLVSSPGFRVTEKKNGLNGKTGPRTSDSVGSVSSDEEENEGDEGSLERGDVPNGRLSTVESQGSLMSKQSSANGTIHSTSIVVENGVVTPQKGKFFSPGKQPASSSTVIPLPFASVDGEGSIVPSVTSESGPSEASIVPSGERFSAGVATSSQTVPTTSLTAGTTQEEQDEEVEEVTAPPSVTVSVDLPQLFRVIARVEKDGMIAPPALKLLYDIVSSEHSLMANKSSAITAISTVRTIFTMPSTTLPSPGGSGLVASGACEEDDQIVVRNMDTNRSLTESGHSTDTANTEAGSNSSGLLGSKRRRLHLKNISKACSSLSRLMSVQHRNNLSSGGRGATGEVNGRTSTVELSSVGVSQPSPTGNRLSKATGPSVVVTSGGGGGIVVASMGGGVVTTVGLTGLNNLGNTCFLSSALQCLTRTPLFVLYFLTQQYKADLNLANTLGSKGKLSEEFARFLSTVFNLNGPAAGGISEAVGSMFGGSKNHKSVKSNSAAIKFDSMSPTALLRAFQAHKPYFTGADQQDAQEFLAELLDTFHEDLKIKKVVPRAALVAAPSSALPVEVPPTPDKKKEMSTERIMRQGEEAWQQYVSGNNSVVSSVFQGQLCNKVTCKVCQTVSVRFEPFTTLSLSIPKLKDGPNSAGGVSESVTVIATVYRKMPRLFLLKQLRILSGEQGELVDEETAKGMDWESLLAYMALCSKPTRVAVSMSRQATVHDIKAKVIDVVNALEGNGLAGSGDNAADQKWSLSSLPPLTQLHTTAIDVNGEERGRIKKILESRETLSSLVDDFQSDYQILVLENNKHIPYISSLPATRLVPSMSKSPRKATVDISRDWRTLCVQYSDELEYSPQHGLYNNDPKREGRVLADLDHTYNKDSFAQFHPTRHNSSNSKQINPVTVKQDDAPVEAATLSNLFDNSLNWPATLDQFRVGDRVDALDHKGSWFSGSVLDVYLISEEDVQAGSLTKHARETNKETPGGKNGRSQTGAVSGNTKTRLAPGTHLRVHFDNFSSIWDEWYDQRDYERGFIFPVYSKAQRKLKIFDLQVVQRRLLPADDTPPQSPRTCSDANPPIPASSEGDDDTSTASGVRLDVFDVPIVVQSESYRSLAHVYKHIVEQMTRFMTPDEVSALVRSQQTGDETQGLDLPFTLRLLSSNNLFAPPLEDAAPFSAEGSESDNRESFHRFFDFKSWEGAEMPRDITRPVVNLFHSRLIIAVDWFRGAEAAAESAPALKHSMSPVDNESYSKYVALVYQKQQLALLAQQQAAVVQPGSIADSQRFKDTRVGLTIEHLLSKFVGLEELDEYYCEACKKLCPALMHSSLHRLPDVLILHLKRLVMNATGGGKIRTLVKFPLLDLDMGPYATETMISAPIRTGEDSSEAAAADATPQSPQTTSVPVTVAAEVTSSNSAVVKPVAAQQQQQQLYELYGVVNHLGGMYGGHYTAFANCEQISLPPPNGAVAPLATVPVSPSKKAYRATTDEEDDESSLFPPQSSHSTATMEPLSLQEYVMGGAGGSAGPSKKKWLKFDDEFVLEVTAAHGSGAHLETSVVTESAYLLFYQRKTLSSSNLQKYL